MIPPRSRIARFNGTEIFRLALFSVQSSSAGRPSKGDRVTKSRRCFVAFHPFWNASVYFEKDAPMIRAIDYSPTRVPGKMEKEEEKITKSHGWILHAFLPVLTTFFLCPSLSPPSSSPFADLVKYLTLHGAESNCHWREFNLRDFMAALRAHSSFSFEIETSSPPTTPVVVRSRTFFPRNCE